MNVVGHSLNFVLPEVSVLLKIDVLEEFKILLVNYNYVVFLFVSNNSKKHAFAVEYYIWAAWNLN